MSGVEARAVLEQSGYEGAKLFALYRIAEVVNEAQDFEWYRTNTAFADELGVSRQSVSSWMRSFKDDGWLEALDEGDGRFGRASRYRFARRFSVSNNPTLGVKPVDDECKAALHAREREPEREPERELSRDPVSDFDAFWNVYPRKVGKAAAHKAHTKAIAAGHDTLEILHGAERTRVEHDNKPTADQRYTPHPATWLNQQRWEDEIAPAPAAAPEPPTISISQPDLYIAGDEERFVAPMPASLRRKP